MEVKRRRRVENGSIKVVVNVTAMVKKKKTINDCVEGLSNFLSFYFL